MTVTDPYDSPTNRLMEMDLAAQRAKKQQPEYQPGPARQPENFNISLDRDTNVATLIFPVAGPGENYVELTLPELEGLVIALQDVWRMAKVKNKQLGKVKSDLEDLL